MGYTHHSLQLYHCLSINMKLIVFIAVLALASARPDVLEEKKPNVAILSSNVDADPNGTYKFNFETEDGVKRDQEGSLKQITEEAAGAVSSGSYSYTDPDGNVVSLSFVADENDSSQPVTIYPNLIQPSLELWSRFVAPTRLMLNAQLATTTTLNSSIHSILLNDSSNRISEI